METSAIIVISIFLLSFGFLLLFRSESNSYTFDSSSSESKSARPKPHSDSVQDQLDFIENNRSDIVERWYWDQKNQGIYLKDRVYKAVQDKINQQYRDGHLEFIERNEPDIVRDWFIDSKKAGDYFTDEVYWSAVRKIGKIDEEKHLVTIEKMTPGEANTWWRRQISRVNQPFFSENVIETLRQKIAPIHEDYLMDELSTKRGWVNRIDNWVKARKKEGYWFSDNAMKEVERIKNEYYY